MHKKAILFGVTAALVLAVVASLGVYAAGQRGPAQQGTPPMPMMMGGMGGHMRGMLAGFAAELNLTPQQKEQLQGIWKEFRTEAQPTFDTIKAKKAELIDLIAQPSPDKAKVTQLTEELNILHGKIAAVAVEKIIDAKHVLTPEQNAAVAKKIEQFKPMLMGLGMPGGHMGMMGK